MKFLFPILLLSSLYSWAHSDTIIVHKDARIEVLTAKQAAINKKSQMMTSNGLYKGFRVQVISTRLQDEALQIKSQLLSKYPEHKTYLAFQSPFYKVRIGNFIDRNEAIQLSKQLSKFYTRGVYVIEDAVEYTPPDEEETNN
jgi:arginine/ornithine N-succinyltransferase beta subunit